MYDDCAEVIRYREMKVCAIPDRYFKKNILSEIEIDDGGCIYKLKMKLILLTARMGFAR